MGKQKIYSYDEMNKLYLEQEAVVRVNEEQLEKLKNDGWKEEEDGTYALEMNPYFVKKFKFVLPKEEKTVEAKGAISEEAESTPIGEYEDSGEDNNSGEYE